MVRQNRRPSRSINQILKATETLKQKKDLAELEKYLQRKERKFLSQKPLQNKDQEFFIYCKTYSISRERSKMVACDVCNDWYRNSCINSKPSFTPYVPLFISNYSIDSRIYHFILILSLILCDIFDTKCISREQCVNEFLTMGKATQFHVMYHQFHSLQQQNQHKKLIVKAKILSTLDIYRLFQCAGTYVVLRYP